MHVGGRPEKTVLTAREQEICAAIGPTLRDQGLIFVGIDVIGDWLTEINVTSPTGLQEVARFDGTILSSADLGQHRGEGSWQTGARLRSYTPPEALRAFVWRAA